ncbi:MAG: hypothetical protein ACW98U_07985 [Candidatus Thorarchaeota archaeon]|jgi:hypothetical protein
MWTGLIITIVAFTVFVVGLYWMTSSKGRGYHSQKEGHVARKKLLREHEQMKERARIEDVRRRMRDFRRR